MALTKVQDDLLRGGGGGGGGGDVTFNSIVVDNGIQFGDQYASLYQPTETTVFLLMDDETGWFYDRVTEQLIFYRGGNVVMYELPDDPTFGEAWVYNGTMYLEGAYYAALGGQFGDPLNAIYMATETLPTWTVGNGAAIQYDRNTDEWLFYADSTLAMVLGPGGIVSGGGTPGAHTHELADITDLSDLDLVYAAIGHNHDSVYMPKTWTVTAGAGLSGGGDGSTNRTLDLDLNELTTDATGGAGNDLIPFVDVSDGNASNKVLVSDFIANVQSLLKPTEHISWAVTRDDVDITTGTAKIARRLPYAFTLTELPRAYVTTPGTGGITVDINEEGASILSTKLTIDSTEESSVTAATPAVLSDSALASDAKITVDVDAVGSGVRGLVVTLIGHRT